MSHDVPVGVVSPASCTVVYRAPLRDTSSAAAWCERDYVYCFSEKDAFTQKGGKDYELLPR